MITFGKKLRQSRQVKKMTQKQLADLVGAKHNSVSDWENDKNKPDPDTIELLCGVLEISPNYLLSTPEDGFSPAEKLVIKKYRELDEHGTKMVDFTLQEEWERSISMIEQDKVIQLHNHTKDKNYLESNAAHPRSDIEIPDGIDTSENSMLDEDF